MDTQLVFVHGRAQEHKDASTLKGEWIEAWSRGLALQGLAIPLTDAQIRFPYYGQTLFDLSSGKNPAAVAPVVIKSATGAGQDDEEQAFVRSVLRETLRHADISDAQIDEVAHAVLVEKGALNWEWVQAAIKALDRFVPHASAASIALATSDVYQYLTNPTIRQQIEHGVREAMRSDIASIVVSHSLGTVVAYDLLRKEGVRQGWRVPLFVTLGSPLAVTEVKKRLAPIGYPECVTHWFNAMDERDVVALYPLDQGHFPVSPAIENRREVDNHTSNRHGISGYLDDPVVARRLYEAITAP